MKNTIIDLIRIPVDEDGVLKYSIDEVRELYNKYSEVFKGHRIFAMPADFTIWEDLDLTALKSIRSFLDEVIEKKEKENNDL
jgi:hypothetical protein